MNAWRAAGLFGPLTCQCNTCREIRCRIALAEALRAGEVDDADLALFDELSTCRPHRRPFIERFIDMSVIFLSVRDAAANDALDVPSQADRAREEERVLDDYIEKVIDHFDARYDAAEERHRFKSADKAASYAADAREEDEAEREVWDASKAGRDELLSPERFGARESMMAKEHQSSCAKVRPIPTIAAGSSRLGRIRERLARTRDAALYGRKREERAKPRRPGPKRRKRS
jgi:hypothetical protein